MTTAVARAPLVGRRREVATVAALLQGLGRSARFLALTGEPGIGKTRLLAEACAPGGRPRLPRARRACRRARARCPAVRRAGGRARRLRRLARPDAAGRRARAGARRGARARVLPSVARASGAGTSLGDERYRTHRAVRALVDALAATAARARAGRPPLGRPGVARPARPSSAQAAAQSGAAGARVPSPAGPAAVLAAFSRAAPDLVSERVELGQLSAGEAEALLGDAVPRRQRGPLYASSGGNPFYLLALARAVRPRARRGRPRRDGELPVPVRAPCSGAGGRLVEQARKWPRRRRSPGTRSSWSSSPRSASCAEDAVLSALDELVACDVLRADRRVPALPLPPPTRPEGRVPVRATGLAADRARRAAVALAHAGASASARAGHIERSAPVGDQDAIELLLDAGRETATRAPATAAHWFEAALRLLPPGEQGPRRVEVLAAAARTLATAGRLDESRAACTRRSPCPGRSSRRCTPAS